MPVLLVQSCSKSKNRTSHRRPALELYDGYFFKIIKKARREGHFRDDIDLCILSAEHGIIDETATIEYYDRRMDTARAEELRPGVVEDLTSRVQAHGHERILFNLGKTYRTAVEGIAETIDADVEHISGGGIGEKGRALKQVIRTDKNAPTVHT